MSGQREVPLFGRQLADADGGLIIVDKEHHTCHQGRAFRLRLSNAALANNGILKVHLNVPRSVEMHLKEISYWCEGKCLIEMKKGGTFSGESGAADIIPYNQALNKASIVKGFTTFTHGGSPSTLSSYTDGGGSNPSSRKSSEGSEKWEHLFENQDITLSIQNLSGAASVTWLFLRWYEIIEHEIPHD